MELLLNDCSLSEAMEELRFQQKRYPNACFKGLGNGSVVIRLCDENIIVMEEKHVQ